MDYCTLVKKLIFILYILIFNSKFNKIETSWCTQLLQVWNDLRLKANLLPSTKKNEFLFICGVSEFFENIPREVVKNSWFANDPAVYDVDNYQPGVFKTLFYVPHSPEICDLENKIAPEYK